MLQLSITDATQAGQIGSRLYAWGTIGSLLGTYVSGLLFIPLLGTSRTLWIFAALLVVTSAFVSKKRHTSIIATAGLLLMIASLALPRPTIKNLTGQIFEAETAHNYISVLQVGQERHLVFNDGFAVQSVYQKDVLPLTGVELDAGVVAIGQKYMGMPHDINIVIEDARTFLAFDQQKYDIILIDAFQFPYVPFQVTTREFFELVESRLADGGAVLLNVGRAGKHRDVVHALVRTAQEVFPTVNAIDVHETYNTIIYAGRHELTQSAGLNALNLRPHTHGRLKLLPTNPKPLALTCCLITAAYFSALQLSKPFAHFHTWWLNQLIPTTQFTVTPDPTDLIALPFLLIAYKALTDCIKSCPNSAAETQCLNEYQTQNEACNTRITTELSTAFQSCQSGQTPNCANAPTPDPKPDPKPDNNKCISQDTFLAHLNDQPWRATYHAGSDGTIECKTGEACISENILFSPDNTYISDWFGYPKYKVYNPDDHGQIVCTNGTWKLQCDQFIMTDCLGATSSTIQLTNEGFKLDNRTFKVAEFHNRGQTCTSKPCS